MAERTPQRQRPRGGDALDNRTHPHPNSLCSDLSSLLDDLSSSCSHSNTTNENSYVYPACLKVHREEVPSQQHAVVTPARGSNYSSTMEPGYNNEYLPLEDSFSDLLHPDRSTSFEAAEPFPYPQLHNPFHDQSQRPPHGGYPMAGIEYPGPNDVMLGRGGATNQHIGNIRFRQLVCKHKLEYITANKGEKPKIAMFVVNTWRSMDPPGRFLQKTNPEMGDTSYWHDVGEADARKKASQCLREKTPDIAPILKKLNQEQEIEEEKMKKKGSPKREAKHKDASSLSSTKKVTPPSVKKAAQSTHDKAKEGKLKKMMENRAAKQDTTSLGSGSGRDAVRSSSAQSGARTSAQSSSGRDVSESRTPSAVAGRVGPRLALVKEKRSRNIREEVSHSTPSAASLVADTFGDFDAQELHESSDSFKLLPRDLEELMQAPSIGNMSDSLGSFGGDSSGNGMDNLSTSTWFRSFRSFENSSNRTPSNRTMMSTTGSSLRGIREEQSGDMEESIDALDLAFPVHAFDDFDDRTANLQKLTSIRGQTSSVSLLSDITGDSSHHRRRMRNARIDSGVSTTSELTDAMSLSRSLSDSLKGMDLAM